MKATKQELESELESVMDWARTRGIAIAFAFSAPIDAPDGEPQSIRGIRTNVGHQGAHFMFARAQHTIMLAQDRSASSFRGQHQEIMTHEDGRTVRITDEQWEDSNGKKKQTDE